MNLYIYSDKKYHRLKEKPFHFEKDLQRLFEFHMREITGLQMVSSEFEIENKRIDTLAFNERLNSFVIIEYKRSRHYSVVDQGITYLSLMLEHKSEILNEYNTFFNKKILENQIKWKNSFVLIVSTDFTEYQLRAVNYKDFPIVLLELKFFENDTLLINKTGNLKLQKF
ncbi:MAG TPA: hypothetical protein VJ455_00965 [Ignavibacteria bacterium]|nr:hypothetical protein [Ignavibacteria bacterium]